MERLRKQYLSEVRQKRQRHEAKVQDAKLGGDRVPEYRQQQLECERFKTMNEGYYKQDRLLPNIFKKVANASCHKTILIN